MKFAILLFDDVEVLDAFGPFEVFSVAARLTSSTDGTEQIEVTLVSAYQDRLEVVARGGLRVKADSTLLSEQEFDVLLVPGGVTSKIEGDTTVMEWLSRRTSTPIIASVCTGAFLLAQAGILTDQIVTTHWEDQEELAIRFPALTVIAGPRWVQQGRIYTSAGISAGLDLALHLLSSINPELPIRVARQMDYAWDALSNPHK